MYRSLNLSENSVRYRGRGPSIFLQPPPEKGAKAFQRREELLSKLFMIQTFPPRVCPVCVFSLNEKEHTGRHRKRSPEKLVELTPWLLGCLGESGISRD